jgi:hypothetical protein
VYRKFQNGLIGQSDISQCLGTSEDRRHQRDDIYASDWVAWTRGGSNDRHVGQSKKYGRAGDYPLYPNTAYSIELNAAVSIPEWNGKVIRMMLEQDGFWDGKQFRYIDGRQETIYPVQRN